MISDRHYRLLRALWLGVFYVLVGTLMVLLSLGWQQHAEALTWLGMLTCVLSGALWQLLFSPAHARKRAARPK